MLIVDCLARGSGGRLVTVDVIGVGPRAVAGMLEREGVEYRIVTFEEFYRRPTMSRGYDVLFVSAMTVDKPAAMKVLEGWRRHGAGPAVLGGPISFGCLRDRSLYRFDVIVWGESENTLPKLVGMLEEGGLDLEEAVHIRGLAFRRDGETVFTGTPPHASRRQLDEMAASTRAILHYREYWAYRVYVETVRGCSNYVRPTLRLPDGRKCTDCRSCREGPLKARLECPVGIPPGCGYCSIPKVYGPPRSRSVESVYREVKELIDLGVTRVVLEAPDFLDYGRDWLVEPEPLTDPREPPANLEALRSLLSRLTSIPEVEEGEASIMIENLKACLVTEEVASLLSEYLGGSTVHIGCETGCEEHCLAIGRPATPREVIEASRILRRYGLRPYVYFIHGLPGQNWHTARETARVIRELSRVGVEKITVYRFRPLPESAFQDYPPGEPYVRDPRSRLIVKAAGEVNVRGKMGLEGETIRCVVVRPRGRRGSHGIGYPLLHGPVVKVREGLRYAGFIVDVRIEGVAGERMVEGSIVRVVKRVYPRRRASSQRAL